MSVRDQVPWTESAYPMLEMQQAAHSHCSHCLCRFLTRWLPIAQVGEVGPDSFSVYLIPETLRATVLGERSVGDTVNVEIDAQTQAWRFSLRLPIGNPKIE